MGNANDKRLFWGCFIALTATAFGFIIRADAIDVWAQQFNLSATEKGQISGAGLWPFAVSIILFSLVIDRIGYGRAMVFAFFAHITYAVVVICAPMVLADEGAAPEMVAAGKRSGYWMLYIGNVIFALGNGCVEAVINPVVATMFKRDKTKWLNILHAGWPGGLVFAGLLAIAMSDWPWQFKIGLIFLPIMVYGLLMFRCKFPISERVEAGSSYRDMLAEFGAIGALIVGGLIVRELGGVLGIGDYWQLAILATFVGGCAFYTRSLGRPMFIFLLLIMVPLAVTELGTDNWITSLMKPAMTELNLNSGWVLVYTSLIMMILRFFAGPIVHKLSPLGLLAISAVLATIGLVLLSTAAGITILIAATVYGVGKTFFWPTMLGVVAEQSPKGGALTLNATGGVGMLSAGLIGTVFIGLIQDTTVSRELEQQQPQLYAEVTVEKESMFSTYHAVDPEKKAALPEKQQAIITAIDANAKQSALKTMAIFPSIMFVCYVALILYFKSKGGYHAKVLSGHDAEDAKFTGGIEGPVE